MAILPPIKVEILGPAGSGKTTLVTALRERDPHIVTAISLTAAERVQALVAVLRSVLPDHAKHYRSARFFSTEELRRIVYVEAWQRRLAADEGCLTDRVLLLDHGPVFMLGMLHAFGPPCVSGHAFRAWSASAVRRWAALLDAVLWLDASDDTLIERIRRRPGWHGVKGRERGEACQFLGRCRTSFEDLVADLQHLGDPALVRLETDRASPEQVVATAATMLGWDQRFRAAAGVP